MAIRWAPRHLTWAYQPGVCDGTKQDFAPGTPALKRMVKPSRCGPMVERLVESYRVSERRACRVLCFLRAAYRSRSCLDPRTELLMRVREIAQARVRYGQATRER